MIIASPLILLKRVDLTPTLIRETQQRLYALYDKGKIKPVIHQADKMDQLQQSLELLANRRIHGKLVLVNPVSG